MSPISPRVSGTMIPHSWIDRTAKGRALVPMHKDLIIPLLEARKGALTDHVIEWAGEKESAPSRRGLQRPAGVLGWRM
jgi:hypothetical protein